MTRISHRLLVPLAAVVMVWGGAHVLGSHPTAISPAVWPLTGTPSPTPSPSPADLSLPSAAAATAPASVPFLPGALQQLNGETGNTAIGLYALMQQLEGALSARLEQLAQQLEPGR